MIDETSLHNFFNQNIVIVYLEKDITTGLLYQYDTLYNNLYVMFAKDSMCCISFSSCKEIVLEKEWFARKLDYILEL